MGAVKQTNIQINTHMFGKQFQEIWSENHKLRIIEIIIAITYTENHWYNQIEN